MRLPWVILLSIVKKLSYERGEELQQKLGEQEMEEQSLSMLPNRFRSLVQDFLVLALLRQIPSMTAMADQLISILDN